MEPSIYHGKNLCIHIIFYISKFKKKGNNICINIILLFIIIFRQIPRFLNQKKKGLTKHFTCMEAIAIERTLSNTLHA